MTITRRMGTWLAVGVVGAVLLTAGPADAAVSCNYDPGAGGPTTGDELVTVEMTGASAVATFAIGVADAITVNGSACGAATTTTTANILVDDNTGSVGSNTVGVTNPAAFAPGTGADDTVPEIEFVLDMGLGADLVSLDGVNTPNRFVIGASGANFNQAPGSDTDLDISYITGSLRAYSLTGGSDADFLSGQGGGGTLGPVNNGLLLTDGRGGIDVVEGGNSGLGSGGDVLVGGTGNDTISGFGAKDSLSAELGDDIYDCGAGTEDRLDYTGTQGNLTLDLATPVQAPHPQLGTDTIVGGCEEVVGTGGADTLSGSGAGEILQGQLGDDVLNGRGGADGLLGGPGTDTVTYADAPSGVVADLGAGTATGGAGNDTITDNENLTGSPFADTLTGNAAGNSIVALGGTDTVSALAGPDAVDVRDGGPDTASCGTELDTATADQASVDSVNADCETISFLAEPDPGGGGGTGDGGGGAADTDIAFDLTGKAKQKLLKQKAVVVRAGCPLEACTATASGKKLKPETEALDAGVPEQIKVPIKRKKLRAIAAALRKGRNPKVAVSASVTDAAGNSTTDKVTVTAKR